MPKVSMAKRQIEPLPLDKYGAKLHINEPAIFDPRHPVSLDVETDEQDNFVGLGMCQSDKDVYYWDQHQWCDTFKDFIGSFKYIMQGGAFDIRMLKKWGVCTDYPRLEWDTRILAYTLDSTLPSYSLKPLAKQFIGMEWPTYKEMVGVGKSKVTLDKQPVERVARYCGLDTLAEWKLKNYFFGKMSTRQLTYFREIEMPLYRLLSQMEDKGVQLNVPHLQSLNVSFGKQVDYWQKLIKDCYGDFNLNSPKQVKEMFRLCGLEVPSTGVKILSHYTAHTVVRQLLVYRKFKKLKSTYTDPFLKSFTLPRLHGRFLQKTITGRLASSSPNLQNIPIRSDEGKDIRRGFVAKSGHKLLVLDYSQIEYRLFAHFTEDPTLIKAYKDGEDIHVTTGRLVGRDRTIGKTINFAAIYGAQPKKIAQTANITESEAANILSRYWAGLPHAAVWIGRTKWSAKKDGGVNTLHGRFIPLKQIHSSNQWERAHAERVGVNAIIQGSAAEIIKKAMLIVYHRWREVPVLQVHDELAYEIEKDKAEVMLDAIAKIMVEAASLLVPLEVSKGIGDNWADTKQ